MQRINAVLVRKQNKQFLEDIKADHLARVIDYLEQRCKRVSWKQSVIFYTLRAEVDHDILIEGLVLAIRLEKLDLVNTLLMVVMTNYEKLKEWLGTIQRLTAACQNDELRHYLNYYLENKRSPRTTHHFFNAVAQSDSVSTEDYTRSRATHNPSLLDDQILEQAREIALDNNDIRMLAYLFCPLHESNFIAAIKKPVEEETARRHTTDPTLSQTSDPKLDALDHETVNVLLELTFWQRVIEIGAKPPQAPATAGQHEVPEQIDAQAGKLPETPSSPRPGH